MFTCPSILTRSRHCSISNNNFLLEEIIGRLRDILFYIRAVFTESNHCFSRTVSIYRRHSKKFKIKFSKNIGYLSWNYEVMKMLTFSLSTRVGTLFFTRLKAFFIN